MRGFCGLSGNGDGAREGKLVDCPKIIIAMVSKLCPSHGQQMSVQSCFMYVTGFLVCYVLEKQT